MKYEFTFLLPDVAEVKTIKEIITSSKGKIQKEETWGEKLLMYPIKKKEKAFYFHWLIDVAEDEMNEMKKKLNFNEKMVRYLLLKTD